MLGVGVDPLTVGELHAGIKRLVEGGGRGTVLNVNANCLNLLYTDAALRGFFDRADLVFCDGAGVMLAARLLGGSIPERITYADWAWRLAAFAEAEGLTKNNRKLDVYVALNYGGRSEIVDAARRIVAEGLCPEEVDEATFASYLYAPEVPEVDLVIRTSGELRISNFLLWQIAYAEFYVTDTLWPDFSPEEFLQALESFASRSRRRGGV